MAAPLLGESVSPNCPNSRIFKFDFGLWFPVAVAFYELDLEDFAGGVDVEFASLMVPLYHRHHLSSYQILTSNLYLIIFFVRSILFICLTVDESDEKFRFQE